MQEMYAYNCICTGRATRWVLPRFLVSIIIMLCKEKSSWNGLYPTSSVTKLSCRSRRIALKRWIKTKSL